MLKITNRKRIPAGYTRKEIKAIVDDAALQFPDATHICHILPRAYCVIKPAAASAVFAVPEPDREPQVKDDGVCTVHMESAIPCEAGKWYRLAYVCRPGRNAPEVIHPQKQEGRNAKR